MTKTKKLVPTCTHWGNYLIETDGKQLLAVHPYAVDKEPTPIAQSLLDAQDKNCRIPQPMVRAGYLKEKWDSDGQGRGREGFVPVSWEVALDLAAEALLHTKNDYGNEAIYGGSYGWGGAFVEGVDDGLFSGDRWQDWHPVGRCKRRAIVPQ